MSFHSFLAFSHGLFVVFYRHHAAEEYHMVKLDLESMGIATGVDQLFTKLLAKITLKTRTWQEED